MIRALLPLLLVTVIPALAIEPTPWLSTPCELSPLNRFGFRYAHCDDSTDAKSLNRLLALNLDNSPEFDKYRLYRKLERPFFVVSVFTAAVLAADILASKYFDLACPESFNPECGRDAVTEILPWQAYAAVLGVSVPLSVVFSRKRIHYQDLLVADFNRRLRKAP